MQTQVDLWVELLTLYGILKDKTLPLISGRSFLNIYYDDFQTDVKCFLYPFILLPLCYVNVEK